MRQPSHRGPPLVAPAKIFLYVLRRSRTPLLIF
jgi:hypothetical protein